MNARKKSKIRITEYIVCMNCIEKSKHDLKDMKFFDYSKKDDYIMLERVGYSFVVGTKPINQEKVDVLTESLKDLVDYKEDNIEDFLKELVETNLKSSIYCWKIFTEFKRPKENDLKFETCFLINIDKESEEYQNIAIMIADSHYRFRIFNFFKNPLEFKKEHDFFKKHTKDPQTFVQMVNELTKLNEDYFINTENVSDYISNFGDYIVIRYDLPNNHG